MKNGIFILRVNLILQNEFEERERDELIAFNCIIMYSFKLNISSFKNKYHFKLTPKILILYSSMVFVF